MKDLTILQNGAPIAPSVIGFNVGGRVVSVGELGRITWRGLLKTGAATAIAAGATAVRGANLAIAEIEYSRAQMQATLATMQAQRDDAVRRAAAAETKARKPARWSAAERDLLLELRAGGMAYGKIAVALGTGRSAAAVGAKWRALAAKASAPAPVAKPASKPRSRRKAAA
jgi:hypothetical protein